MNSAVCTAPLVLDEWRALLAEGLENPEQLVGTCQVRITEGPENTAHPLAVTLCPQGCAAENAWANDPSATLTVPLSVAERLVRELHHVDYRDPSLMGQIEMAGDRALINHVVKALLRPSGDERVRIQNATQRITSAYQLKQIQRIERPDEMAILERIEAGEPFIATGIDLPTPCADWTLDLLATRFGDVPLRIRSAHERETVAELIQRVRAAQQDMELGSADGQLIEGATKVYTEGCGLPNAMREDFMPRLLSLDDYCAPQIWLGSVPANVPASSLHRDPLDGFLFQVMGRKRLILFAPDQAEKLYPMKAWSNYQPCWVKPEAPDHSLYPMFSRAQGLEVVLHPGELLIQPAGWFHAVYYLDSPTFSVSYFLKH